jgi:ectoine hydroxylase-related dioxygenase (phytanoyl-CoA dioxygenase family)
MDPHSRPASGAAPDPIVAESAVEAYRRDGAVVLRGVLTPAQLSLLEHGIEANLAAPSPLGLVASQPDDPGRFFEDFCCWQRIPEYEAVLRDSALPSIAARLMGSRTVRVYHDHLLVKEPGTRQPTPWHQDQPYYNVDGRQNVSFWIPIDPVPRAATLEFLAGSHEGTWFMPRTFLNREAKWFPEGSLAEIPDMGDPALRERVIGWALEPGDCVAFHMLTLHATAGTGPGRRRRVFGARYLGDDATHAPRPWRTSPPFEGLAQRLPAGGPMDDPLFPRVWPRP